VTGRGNIRRTEEIDINENAMNDAGDGVRVMITGHGADGEAIVVGDRRAPALGTTMGTTFHMLWGTDDQPAYPDNGSERDGLAPMPPPGGIRLVETVVLPAADGAPAGEVAEGLYQREGDAPGMHITPSLDLVVVLEGEVWMELSGGETVHLRAGDYLVQNGTRHAWHNHTSTPARLGVVVVGAMHSGL